MEISLIFFKDRLVSSFFIFNLISRFSISLKKEAIEYLNDLAIEFRRNSKSQISNTIKRAIQENFYLNNQINDLSSQLDKLIDKNQKTNENNQHLTRTVAILEDLRNESAKKYFTTENVKEFVDR